MEKSELQKSVEDWLREQGYPLEMRTARAFGRRGWFLHHSRRYTDPILGKEREIDVLAFYDDHREIDGKSQIHGHFVIECKWTTKKPWVLFASQQEALTPIGHFMSTPMTASAARIVKPLESKDVSSFPLFAGLEEGYAIVQAFSKDAAIDAAHAGVHAVISAADFFARQMSEVSGHGIVFVPTLVLDGELFRCRLSEGGDVSVQPVDIACLLYHSAGNPRSTCVHVIRESSLETFIDRAERTFDALRAATERISGSTR